MTGPLLISLHIPKTAGSSFRQALSDGLGEARLHLDYGHGAAFAQLAAAGCDPLDLHRRWLDMGYLEAARAFKAARGNLEEPVACVHGHFPAVKYLPALAERRTRFVTWLREPLSRMVSNYRYWMSLDPAGVEDPLVARVLRENWSLEAFCLSPALANYQSLWLRRVPLKLFTFIGVMEHYEQDLERLSSLLKAEGLIAEPLKPKHLNSSPAPDDREAESERRAALRPAFEKLHARDMKLYRHTLAKRELALGTRA